MVTYLLQAILQLGQPCWPQYSHRNAKKEQVALQQSRTKLRGGHATSARHIPIRDGIYVCTVWG